MNIPDTIRLYRENGFTPFPLAPLKKTPMVSSLRKAEKACFLPDSNLAVFTTGDFAVIDADNERSQAAVTARLKALGLYDWTTIVRTPGRGGLHFWLRLADKPVWAQVYYKLDRHIGGGEFRVNRPAYVAVPWSRVPNGEYTFVQGGVDRFREQPPVRWKDLLWLAPGRMNGSDVGVAGDITPLDPPRKERVNPRPGVMKLLRLLEQGETKIPRVNGDGYFDTRSEAEMALVLGLVRAGWSFDDIQDVFDHLPNSHYMECPQPQRYLVRTYNKAVTYLASRSG